MKRGRGREGETGVEETGGGRERGETGVEETGGGRGDRSRGGSINKQFNACTSCLVCNYLIGQRLATTVV